MNLSEEDIHFLVDDAGDEVDDVDASHVGEKVHELHAVDLGADCHYKYNQAYHNSRGALQL